MTFTFNTIVKPLIFQLVTSSGMCYAHSMRFDFHSHFPSPDSIVCTAEPGGIVPEHGGKQPCLMEFRGLLPDRWTEGKQAQLFELLAADKDIHMGEVGLDKRFTDLIPMQEQAAILSRELEFAIRNNRNISLHCVRATGPMLEILDSLFLNDSGKDGLTIRPFSVIWHGFTGSAETARQLAKKNIIISIGPRFTGSIAGIFRANPLTVPETDYEGTDAQEHSRILEEQCMRFQRELVISSEELDRHCAGVFDKLNTGC